MKKTIFDLYNEQHQTQQETPAAPPVHKEAKAPEPEKVDPAEETPDPEPEKAEEKPDPEPEETEKGGGASGVS